MENKKQLDKSNLRQVILDFPKQFAKGFEIAKDIHLEENFTSLVISGMGGSALPADILSDYLKNYAEEDIEIFCNRSYSLPKESYNGALNFIVSYSGNTEETISCLNEAIEKNLPVVCFANGGKISEIAKEKNIPLVSIPNCIQPRYATGYFFSSMLKIIFLIGLTKDASSVILENSKKLEEIALKLEEKGQMLAKKISGKTPIIYTSDKYKSLGMVIKIKINENAKTPAFYNFYPELSHNEMVGFSLPQSQFHVLSFLSLNDHPQIRKRMGITAELYKEKGIGTEIIGMENENIFLEIFSALLLGDWISYYLALEYGQDPTPVEMVEKFKKLL